MATPTPGMSAFRVAYIRNLAALFTCVTLVISVTAGCAQAAAVDAAQPSVWRHRQANTSYFGITTVYTCTAIEDAVKRMLLYFGARSDLKVKASCADPIRPVKTAVVHADFYSLEPASTNAANTVAGQWVTVQLMPERPRFMDRGQCELVDQLKGLLTQDFSLRDVRYQTICTPYDESLLDYDVKAQVLKPLSAGN